MIPIRTEWHAVTDVGSVRTVNEDRFFVSEELGLWAVADGMGGMARGDWASGQVVAAFETLERHAGLADMLDAATAALARANDIILRESEVQGSRMGTTAVLLVVRDRDFGIAWVGDSRGYLLRGGCLYRLTRDHSQVQEMVDHGLLDDADAAKHPMRNVLTRAVGVVSPLAVDTAINQLEADDLVLLCSDGLYGVIGEAEMEDVLTRLPVQDAARAMIARCHQLGAPDNITLVAVSTVEVTLVQFGAMAPEA